MLKVRMNDEYKDVESVYTGNTPIDTIYSKDGSVVFSANREIEGILPLTFKGYGKDLKNYCIYGNTVDGESVGDRTANLFDFGEWSKNINANRGNIAKGIDGITITANSDDAFTIPYAYVYEGVYKIYVKPNTNYLLSWVSNNNLYGRVFIFKNGIPDNTHMVSVNNNTTKYLLFGTDADTEFITLRFGVETTGNTITYSKIMLIEGSTALPYEPYGYRVPVTVANETDTETTNLYLPEQIKKVGDEAEYVDYKEQKQHRVRKNLLRNTATSRTISDVTFTVNDNGSVTCNGTARGNIFFKIGDILTTNQYSILAGCPINGTNNSYLMRCYSNNVIIATDTGSGVSINQIIDGYVEIRIASGYTCDNLVFYPMIRKADISDDTYEPYIENTELDVTLPALPTLSGTNTLTMGTAVQPSKVEITGKIKQIP